MTSACYGLRSPFLAASCPRGKHIVVRNVFANAKPRYTNCPEETEEDVPVDPNCCVCTPDDCLMEYSGVSKMMYYTECNGRQSCNPRVSWQPIGNTCPHRHYLLRSNYMVMEYYCVDGIAVTGSNNTVILDNRIDRVQKPRLVKADSLSNSTLRRSTVGSTTRTSVTIPPTTNTPTASSTTTTIPPTTKTTPRTTKAIQTTAYRTTTTVPLTTTTKPPTTTKNPLTTTTTPQRTTSPIATITKRTTTTTQQTTTPPSTTTTTPQTTTLSLIIIPMNSNTSSRIKFPSQTNSFPQQLGSATNKPRITTPTIRTRQPQPITTTVKSSLTPTTSTMREHLSIVSLPTEQSDKAGSRTTISFRASLKQNSTETTFNGDSFSETAASASNTDFASAKCIVTTECHTSIIINIIDAGQCPFKMLIRNLKGDSWSLCDINNNGFDTYSNVLLIYGNDSGVDVEFGNPWLQFISSDHFTDVFLLCNKMNTVNDSIRDCYTPVSKATDPAVDYDAYPGLKNWEVALIAVGVLFILTFTSLCIWAMYSRRKKNRDRRRRFSLPAPQHMEPRPDRRLQTPTIVRIPDSGADAGVNFESSPRRSCGERTMLPTIVSMDRVNPGGTARPQLPPILHRPRFTSS
ncbi:hypothetical protein SNE40_005747 [Patella caerulea]